MIVLIKIHVSLLFVGADVPMLIPSATDVFVLEPTCLDKELSSSDVIIGELAFRDPCWIAFDEFDHSLTAKSEIMKLFTPACQTPHSRS